MATTQLPEGTVYLSGYKGLGSLKKKGRGHSKAIFHLYRDCPMIRKHKRVREISDCKVDLRTRRKSPPPVMRDGRQIGKCCEQCDDRHFAERRMSRTREPEDLGKLFILERLENRSKWEYRIYHTHDNCDVLEPGERRSEVRKLKVRLQKKRTVVSDQAIVVNGNSDDPAGYLCQVCTDLVFAERSRSEIHKISDESWKKLFAGWYEMWKNGPANITDILVLAEDVEGFESFKDMSPRIRPRNFGYAISWIFGKDLDGLSVKQTAHGDEHKRQYRLLGKPTKKDPAPDPPPEKNKPGVTTKLDAALSTMVPQKPSLPHPSELEAAAVKIVKESGEAADSTPMAETVMVQVRLDEAPKPVRDGHKLTSRMDTLAGVLKGNIDELQHVISEVANLHASDRWPEGEWFVALMRKMLIEVRRENTKGSLVGLMKSMSRYQSKMLDKVPVVLDSTQPGRRDISIAARNCASLSVQCLLFAEALLDKMSDEDRQAVLCGEIEL